MNQKELKQKGRRIQTFAQKQSKENNDGRTRNREELKQEEGNTMAEMELIGMMAT
jgi:Fic family protein